MGSRMVKQKGVIGVSGGIYEHRL